MAQQNKSLPVYSLRNFSKGDKLGRAFQAEVFDARRHFEVQYPHRHDFFEVLYLRRGSGYHIIDSNKYEITPPCVFFMSPGQAHKLELSHDIDGFIYIFTSEFYQLGQSNENSLLELPFFFTLQGTNPPLQLTNESDRAFIESLFVKATLEALKDNFSIALLHALLNLILVYLTRLYPSDSPLLNKGKGQILVKKFYQAVEENYSKNISIADYAGLLNVSSTYLTKTTRELTGRTPNNILKDKVIIEIKRLLTQTGLDIQEISAMLNFADQSYFTKYFKSATGLTPMQFREKTEIRD